MTFSPQPKPDVPLVIERHQRKLQRQAREDAIKREAKRRDGNRCRWPHCEYSTVTQPIDPAHVFEAKGMGGDPQLLRTERGLLMALCRLHHRQQEKHDLEVEALTVDLADGPCAFWRIHSDGTKHLVAQERSVGVLWRD